MAEEGREPPTLGRSRFPLGLLFTYLLLLFVPAYLLVLLGWPGGGSTRLALMLIPGAAALLLRRLIRWEGWGGAGLRLGRPRYYLWAWLIPVAVALLGQGLALLLGWGTWDLPPTSSPEASPELSFLAQALAILTIFLVPGLLLGLGEELGWRGYLLPRLWSLGPWRAFLLVGLIWWLWHWPLGLVPFGDFRFSLLAILLGVANATLLGIVLAWLYSASGSILAPALAYTTYHNSTVLSQAVKIDNPHLIALLTALSLAAVVLLLVLRGEIGKIELKT